MNLLDRKGFSQPGNAFYEDVPAGGEHYEKLVNNLVLIHNDHFDLGLDLFSILGKSLV